jgi:hypothetical protein
MTPGSGEISGGKDFDSCHYAIKDVSNIRKQVELTYWAGAAM